MKPRKDSGKMINILLPCYNGSRYISEQIDSILNQTYQDFILYINDDCSTDDTFEIIKKYEKKYPDKIIVSRNNRNLGSAQAAFMHMMLSHKGNYTMLSDQDDVWNPDKIEKTYALIQKAEMEKGVERPILVHSDISVADEALNITIPSYKTYMKTNLKKKPFSRMLIQNAVTGCTIMYNAALGNIIRGVPEEMMMHDWWLMLIASAFGELYYLPEATLKYRQHSNNVEGMEYIRTIKYKVHKFIHRNEIDKALKGTYKQAGSFMNEYKAELSLEQLYTLKKYCTIQYKNKIGKWSTIFSSGYFKDGIMRNIALLIFV